MMYNYPYFSFPHFRRCRNYPAVQYPYVRNSIVNQYQQPKNNITNQIGAQIDSQINLGKLRNSSQVRNVSNGSNYIRGKNSYNKKNYIKQEEIKKEGTSSKKVPSGFSFLNNFLNQEDRGEDEECFDLFGLKLYNDDLLLIGLIFFLYKEDVKDQYLFFSLILLLLS